MTHREEEEESISGYPKEYSLTNPSHFQKAKSRQIQNRRIIIVKGKAGSEIERKNSEKAKSQCKGKVRIKQVKIIRKLTF